MYLVTTALREFWPESGSIWLLSPGCSPDPNDAEVKGNWEIKGVVSDPFQNESEMTAAYAEIWRITDDLIGLLASRLNVIHNTDHTERYWRTLIGFWAVLFVSVVYDRHARLLKAKSEIGHIKVIGCNDVNHIIPLDTRDFTCEATDDLYNCQIYTFLCSQIGIPVVEHRSAKSISRAEKALPSRNSFVKGFLSSVWFYCFDMLSSVFGHRADVLMVASYLPRWFEVALSFVTRGQVFPLYPKNVPVNMPSNSPINAAARSLLSEAPEGYDGIPALVFEMVVMCIPKSYVEDYQQVCSQSDKVYKNYQPKAIYSANSWFFVESFKQWAAKCQEQGSKLIGGAHGGSGFIQKYGDFVSFEVILSDYYLTWGWSDPKDAKLYPTPACKLINLAKRSNHMVGEGILYVGTAIERHQVMTLADFSVYPEWQRRFFVNIPQPLISKFLVRHHYMDYGWNIKDRLAKAFPSLQFDSWEVGFRDRLNRCRLYVCDHLSTTYAEALAANVPTILFWSETLYPVRETAKPHIQALKDCNVLHDTPESAAAWVAEVYDDPAKWWLSESCQKAVKDFCCLYARTSEKPLKDWKKTFEVLVSLEKSGS